MGRSFETVGAAQARIGWTLEQCKTQYGEASKYAHQKPESDAIDTARAFSDSDDSIYVFASSGFKITIGFHEGVANVITYEPANNEDLTYKQASEILSKNSGTVWKREKDLEDDTADLLTTKGKHDYEAYLIFDIVDLSKSGAAANRSHVAGVVIIDDTIHNGEAAKSKAKDDKEKATKNKAQQDSVDNL